MILINTKIQSRILKFISVRGIWEEKHDILDLPLLDGDSKML